MIAGLAVGMAFSYAPVATVKHVTRDRGTVYVDPTRLMTLHPSWQALDMMKKTLVDMGYVDKSSPASVGDVRVARVPVSESAKGNSLLREQLRTEATREAVGALGQLETERRQAVGSRSRSMRDDMASEEERKLKLQAQEIESGVSDQLKVVAEENTYDRINAQLKLSALKAAGRSKGVDTTLISSKISSAQSDLDRVNRISTTQSNEVMAQAAAGIDKLSSEAQDKINATLDIYERGENRRIEEQIAAARDQILSELDSHVSGSSNKDDVFAKQPKGTTVVASVVGGVPRTKIRGDAAELKGRIKQLEAQILNDVTRAARAVGNGKGVNVVFVRGDAHKDLTDDFARSMRRIDWGAYEPVMLDALGS